MNYDDAMAIVQNARDELDALTDESPVSGYGAEDEIDEAVGHLDAALNDLQNGKNNQ